MKNKESMNKKGDRPLFFSHAKKRGLSPFLMHALIVLMVVFITYLPALQNDFVNWDDDVFLLQNEAIRGLSFGHIKEMFLQTINTTYVPLTSLSYAIEYYFFGFNPFVFHLNNLFLFLGGVFFVFLFCLQMGLSLRAASLAALLFGIHPMRVESVAWVTERKDTLYALFYMMALWQYLKYLQAQDRRHFMWTIFFSALSTLAKPVGLNLPIVFLLLDWFKQRKWSAKVLFEKVWVFIPVYAIAQVTMYLHPRAGTMPLGKIFTLIPQHFLRWIWGGIFYIRQFVCPYSITLFYKVPHPITLSNPHYSIPFLVFILLLVSLIVFRKQRLYVFAMIFYVITIFVMIFFSRDQDAQFVADRYGFVPTLGFCIWVGYILNQLILKYKDQKQRARMVKVFVAILLVSCSIRSSLECRVWKNGVALWSHQIQNNPSTVTAVLYNKLGEAYFLTDSFQASMKKYVQYTEMTEEEARQQEESIRKDIAKFDEVIGYQEKALAIKKDYVNAYYCLGDIYKGIKDYERAEYCYLKPLEFNPEDVKAYYLLAVFYRDINQDELSQHFYNEGLKKVTLEKDKKQFKMFN